MRTTQSHPVGVQAGAKPKQNVDIKSGYAVAKSTTWLVTAAIVLFAYIAGVAYGRTIGQTQAALLAQFYLDKQSYAGYFSVLLRYFAASFAQLTLVAFLGLHIFGAFLPVLFLAMQGIICGICAAGVGISGGAKALVIYWLISCLPIVTNCILTLWVCVAACEVGKLMLGLACNTVARGTTLTKWIKVVMVRYLFSVAVAAAFGAVGALLAVFFADVLL